MGGDKGKQTTDMTPEEKNDQGGAEPMHGHELDAFLGKAFEEKPLWADLWESVRDVFFPVKLPPLQLTSQPIPVPDRMAVKTNPWAVGIATTINITILCIVLFFLGKKVIETVKPSLLNTNIDISDYKAPKADTRAGGGGGGGDREHDRSQQGQTAAEGAGYPHASNACDRRPSQAARDFDH